MPVRRKKALTKAQIAALAAYEPHLSAASRAACLEATKPKVEVTPKEEVWRQNRERFILQEGPICDLLPL